MVNPSKVCAGFSLIMAIVMIVLFSLFAAVISKIISTSSEALSYEILGARAFLAAHSGSQWAQQKLAPIQGNPACLGLKQTPISIGQIRGLENCVVATVQCDAINVDEQMYYTVRSTGICQFGSVAATRTVQIEFKERQAPVVDNP